MSLLVSGRHVGVHSDWHQHGISMASRFVRRILNKQAQLRQENLTPSVPRGVCPVDPYPKGTRRAAAARAMQRTAE